MGVTVSHTAISPLSLSSTIFGFVGFAFTLATLVNVFWSSLATLFAAPEEISDYLSNLKQGLLEERRHLKKVRKRMRSARRHGGRSNARSRSRSQSHGPISGGYRSGGPRRKEKVPFRSLSRGRDRRDYRYRHQTPYVERDYQSFQSTGEESSLRSMRIAVRDMIKQFRSIEFPFLKPEFQNQDSTWNHNTHRSSQRHGNVGEKATYGYPDDQFSDSPPRSQHQQQSYNPHTHHSIGQTNHLGNEYRSCGLRERWLWLRRKRAVVSLHETLSRIEIRRTAHEVGEVLMLVGNLGRDVEEVGWRVMGVEERLGRVVGVRRVD